MTYLVVKAVHLCAAIFWMGTMLVAPALLMATNRLPELLRQKVAKRYHTLIGKLSNISMSVTWVLGISLMHWGSWVSHSWMVAKLVLVVVMSALHGVIVGTWRRMSQAEEQLVIQLLLLLGIVGMVMLKPF